MKPAPSLYLASLLVVGAALAAKADGGPATSGNTNMSIPYSTEQVIEQGDSAATIAEKAAKVLPRKNQTDWFRMEQTFFIHFGPNTFRHVEWGDGREDPSVFNPTELNAEQWVLAVKEAGGKMIVPVCKHHDGFCLWPTRYETHSVAASPWRGGKGNLIREVADAAKKHGIKLGVYLSPADLYQLRTNPKNPHGYYGNNSPKLKSVIPTDPASFKTDPSKGRTPPAGFKSYTYEVNDYNRYFLNQLYELLTEYGPIHEVWFDGANPDPSVPETYDYAAWYDLIRKLQPQAIIFGKGPDGRWVGNEGGWGRTTEWSVIPLPKSPETFTWPDMYGDLGSRPKLTPGSHLWWYPAEVNLPILHGWFWAPKKACRTGLDLINVYYQSVGRNGIWLLNLSPDDRGLIPDDQLTHLRLMSRAIRDTFAKNLARGGKLTADSSNPANSASKALDGNLDTWWEAAPGQSTAELTLKLPAPVTFDVVSLQEAVDHRGQRIESFDIDAWDGARWNLLETTEERTTVGFKRLMRLKNPAQTGQVRIRITGSRIEPTLAEIGLFKQAELVTPPVISERDVNGMVTIKDPRGYPVVYTTDGSTPSLKSPRYGGAINFNKGGRLSAASVTPEGELSLITTKAFPGISPKGWQVIAVDSEEIDAADNAASNAIDDNLNTIWHTRWNDDGKLPHSLTVDMGHEIRIAGFTYVPRTDSLNGVVDTYRFETSTDGKNWTVNIDQGKFDNIQNNPITQEVPFAPVTARYFRFTALKEVNGRNWTSAAEISVVPAAK